MNLDPAISLDGFFRNEDAQKFIPTSVLRSDATITTSSSTRSTISSFDESIVWSDCASSVVSGTGCESSSNLGSNNDGSLYFDDSSCGIISSSNLPTISEAQSIRGEFFDKQTKSQVFDLEFHKIIGEGEFGQVWIASINDNTNIIIGNNDVSAELLAVKVLSKHHLVMKGKDTVDRIVREVRILREIKKNSDRNQKQHSHPCLTRMIDTRYDDNLIYIIQEFYSGGELFAILHGDNSNIIVNNVQFYAACIIDALRFLHKRGIIYRDIKPENIVIRQDTGYPVLVDFGYAKQIHQKQNNIVESFSITSSSSSSRRGNKTINNNKKDKLSKWIKSANSSWVAKNDMGDIIEEDNKDIISDNVPLKKVIPNMPLKKVIPDLSLKKIEKGIYPDMTSSNDYDQKCYSMVGSPKYVAPEIILGNGYDFRADLWSFGVLIYEMLAEYNPMGGPNCDELDESELYRCITEEDYIPLPNIIQINEPDATQLINELLVRDPNNRLSSASNVANHQWFQDINFHSLRKQKIDAPWKPNDIPLHQNKDNLSTPYFDNLDYLQNDPDKCFFKKSYPKLSLKETEMFKRLETNISS